MDEVFARRQGIWAKQENSADATFRGAEGDLVDVGKSVQRADDGGSSEIIIYREMLY